MLLRNDSGPIFLHCRRGKDRTGTIVACYRIQHDNWDNRRALEEAGHFGMSSLERAMRSYIEHFTPVVLPVLNEPH
jgi:protein tyrosine/serine phosphatase